jgi:hypothetical protein
MAFTHGTSSGYCHHGCRCVPCTAANRDRVRRTTQMPIREDKHGTLLNYARGCRCPACYDAQSASNRLTRTRRAAGWRGVA